MTRTGRRACLSLGAMAKTLHEINLPESDRIVERLEAWLEPHNQSKLLQYLIHTVSGSNHSKAPPRGIYK